VALVVLEPKRRGVDVVAITTEHCPGHGFSFRESPG
jgi:hypothetical protein